MKLYYNDANGTTVLLVFVVGPVFGILYSHKMIQFLKEVAVFDISVRIWKINQKNILMCIF